MATSATRNGRVRASISDAPTGEVGRSNLAGSLPWSSFAVFDQPEQVPDLVWPNSIRTYNQMRTDAQANGLYLGVTLPIRRYRWMIAPNKSRSAIVDAICEDFNLPVQGEDDPPAVGRISGRFSWDEHLRQALLGLVYGHYYFETEGVIRDGLWRLKEEHVRPPGTIAQVDVSDTGELLAIKQAVGIIAPTIVGSRIVPYVWDKEGGNWFGRSLFRHMYKHWLLKDRLLRIDAIKHDRSGLGTPIAEAPPGASGPMMDRLDALARSFRIGEQAGAAVPAGTKFRMVGTEGSLPDTLASIQYHDEQMARALLMMFIQLGQTRTGSRALGETFSDYFNLAQETIALWIEDTVNRYIIENWVTWNYSDEENAPRLVHDRNPDPELAVSDLVSLIDKGAITVDPEFEDYIRERYKLPPKPEEPEPEPQPALPTTNVIPPQLPPGSPVPEQTPAAPAPTQAQQRRRRTTAAAAGLSLLPLPARQLRRQPYEQEVRAAVDYAAMDADYNTAKAALVAEVQKEQARQIQELHDSIVAAKGNLKKIAKIQASPIHADTIVARMIQMAQAGAYQAINEAARQGVTVHFPDLTSALNSLQARATATDSVLARSISEAASRKALQLSGKTTAAADVAADVKTYLSGLSGRYLEDQLGGVLQAAMNTGRKEVMDDADPTEVYASELLDDATCENCVEIDGTEYPDLQAAEADYPTGGYMDCLGGPRCRGTLIAVYGDQEVETA